MSRSAERIVSLLWLLLEAGANGRTKNEIFSYLYNYLDASEAAKQRQFSRDKEVLTSIGVPIQWRAHGARDDVYLIDHDQLYLPELHLTDTEIQALHQARALWMKTPIEDAIHTALARITAKQPTSPPTVGAQLSTGHTLLTDLVAAAREQAPVKFRYRTADHHRTGVRRVRPWAVLMAHQQWYLVGWDFQREAQRMFRLSRIESKTLEPLAVELIAAQHHISWRPENFDIAAWRRRLRRQHPATTGLVWLRDTVVSPLRLRSTSQAHRDGWELLRLTYHDPQVMAAQIAALTTNAWVDPGHDPQLSQRVTDIMLQVHQAHTGPAPHKLPPLRTVPKTRRRIGNKEVIARRLGIIAVVNQHAGSMSRAALRQRFDISDKTLTQDLESMRFWGMPEVDFAGHQFELDPHADPVTISNADLLAQPWQLSAPEALGLISGLGAVGTIPGISDEQRAAARSLETTLREALELIAPQVGSPDPVVHPDLSLGPDDQIAEILHGAIEAQQVVAISYYSESSQTISQREIEPLQLRYAAGYGYVQAWCRNSDAVRTFRLDRIGTADATGRDFDRPASPAHARDISHQLPEDALTVTVHASHRHRDALEAYQPTHSAVRTDGSVFASLDLRSLDTLLELLTAHPGEIIVVSPAAVRDNIAARFDDALTGGPDGSHEVDLHGRMVTSVQKGRP